MTLLLQVLRSSGMEMVCVLSVETDIIGPFNIMTKIRQKGQADVA